MVRVAIALLLVVLMASAAHAQKRVALVIGNSAYARVGKLTNPTRNADEMEALFRNAGFSVVEAKRDLGLATMRRVLRDFSDQAGDADIAAVFFAGHGIEVNGINYLIPVDAVLERDIDVEDETVSLDRVMQLLEQAKRLRLVILDACRDNPFTRTMRRTGRSVGRGLAKVDVLTSDTLIAFAARHGSTAADGEGANSPYTTALLRHLTTPGLDLRLALGRVRDEVLKSTGNRQEPFVYGSLGGAEISLSATGKLPAQSGAQAGGLFTAGQVEHVKALAENHQLILPAFQIEAPGPDVSDHLRRFVGIWVYESDREARRKAMMIITRVERDGALHGHWVYGASGPTAPAAGDFRIVGTITGDSLRFFDPIRSRTFEHTLTSDNRMRFLYTDDKGQTASAVSDPVWTLVEAERSARR